MVVVICTNLAIVNGGPHLVLIPLNPYEPPINPYKTLVNPLNPNKILIKSL